MSRPKRPKDDRTAYEVIAARSVCWSAFATGRPVPRCQCSHHAFERGDPVTVPAVNVPARFRTFGRAVAVTVYPDGRMVEADELTYPPEIAAPVPDDDEYEDPPVNSSPSLAWGSRPYGT